FWELNHFTVPVLITFPLVGVRKDACDVRACPLFYRCPERSSAGGLCAAQGQVVQAETSMQAIYAHRPDFTRGVRKNLLGSKYGSEGRHGRGLQALRRRFAPFARP